MVQEYRVQKSNLITDLSYILLMSRYTIINT